MAVSVYIFQLVENIKFATKGWILGPDCECVHISVVENIEFAATKGGNLVMPVYMSQTPRQMMGSFWFL